MKRTALCTLVLLLVSTGTARAMVNPSLQPYHLFERYVTVIGGVVEKIDEANDLVIIRVTARFKGAFKPDRVTLVVKKTAGEEGGEPADPYAEMEPDLATALEAAAVGGKVVAFIGKTRLRHEREGLLYIREHWHEVELADLASPERWIWKSNLGDEMVGTYFGRPELLYDLCQDTAAHRVFFPAMPYVKFLEATTLGTLGGPVRGVALHDVNGDGRLDAFACEPTRGGRLYLRATGGGFADATQAMGLGGVKSVSCSFADFNADGRCDLLADNVIYAGTGEGFAAAQTLAIKGAVLSAAFVELNGDGYPDVVIACEAGGLRAFMNPGPGGRPEGAGFTDATAKLGLDAKAAGAGETFYFVPGDWNGDGRCDLFLSTGNGILLVQNNAGRFQPVKHDLRCSFEVTNPTVVRHTGAGCFAPIMRADTMDLVVAADIGIHVIANHNGTPIDVTGLGNESRLAHGDHRATLAEDLNADGNVDLLTLSSGERGEHAFHNNRGYGQFMFLDVNPVPYTALPGKAFETGAGGAAAGDVNGDGTADLLLGGVDGVLRLCLNDTLSRRKPTPHPTPNERILENAGLLSVHVRGPRGVTGATVTLTAADGRILARRQIGTQVLTGCSGPNSLCLAVREPGRCTLTVRFADGHAEAWPVELTARKHVVMTAARGTGSKPATTQPATRPAN